MDQCPDNSRNSILLPEGDNEQSQRENPGAQPQHQPHRPRGPLTTTSRNVQTFAQGTPPPKLGPDENNLVHSITISASIPFPIPSITLPSSNEADQLVHTPTPVNHNIQRQQPQQQQHQQQQSFTTTYPIPSVIIPSNDIPNPNPNAANLVRLHARRQHKAGHVFKRRVENARPYLLTTKYTEYRARRRQDTGKDGKPVWDDPMEDAFQNALVCIKPMGRCKKSQNGKPNGRNELIAEWIKHETGEIRDRKQVSSHIQVLNGLLKGIPEWDVLVKAPDKDSASGPATPGNVEYYGNSIEQAVRRRQITQNSGHIHAHTHHGNQQHQHQHHSHYNPQAHHITKISFEMWVCLSQRMDEALHSYTRLQSNTSISEPITLESVKNWRSNFPLLRPIIESNETGNLPASERCDIILLDASYKLMVDFAPEGSKLGISLELDFLDPSIRNHRALRDLNLWSYSTYVYSRGREITRARYTDCLSASVGKVKPFFESAFWATIFTQTTEKMRKAEDSMNDGNIEVAKESCRNYFQGLTAMQEVWVRPTRNNMEHGIWGDEVIPDEAVPPKRMAILLWRFSQVRSPCVGTTTWQRLIPPPDRMATNSPLPIQEMGVPPMTIDHVVDMGQNIAFDHHGYVFLPSEGLQHDYLQYEDNLMPDMNNMTAMHTSFGLPSQHSDPHGHDVGMQQYSFDLPPHDAHYLEPTITHGLTNNIFEAQYQPGFQGQEVLHSQHLFQEHTQHSDSVHDSQRELLHHFDVNTHKALQAKLGHEQTGPSESHDPDEALRAALVAASSMDDLGHQSHQEQSSFHEQDYAHEDQENWSTPTPRPRPKLVSHASYAIQHESSHHDSQAPVQEPLQHLNAPLTSANHGLPAHSSHARSQHTSPTREPRVQAEGERDQVPSQHVYSSHREHTEEAFEELGGSFVDVREEVEKMGGSSGEVRHEELEDADVEHRLEQSREEFMAQVRIWNGQC